LASAASSIEIVVYAVFVAVVMTSLHTRSIAVADVASAGRTLRGSGEAPRADEAVRG
jgi:hypothetical protein